MEVDATRRASKPVVRRGPLTEAERAFRRLHNLCMYCEKAGHVANDCPAKGPNSFVKPVRSNATH